MLKIYELAKQIHDLGEYSNEFKKYYISAIKFSQDLDSVIIDTYKGNTRHKIWVYKTIDKNFKLRLYSCWAEAENLFYASKSVSCIDLDVTPAKITVIFKEGKLSAAEVIDTLNYCINKVTKRLTDSKLAHELEEQERLKVNTAFAEELMQYVTN